MKVINIFPRSSFRVNIDSDTIWGSIIWALKHIYSEREFNEILEAFIFKTPPFIISSFLPSKKDKEKIIYFLPKPNIRLYTDGIDSSKLKDYKKVKFIPSNDFFLITKSKEDQINYISTEDWKKSKVDFKTEQIQHNTIDRLKGGTLEGNLFYTTEVFYGNNYGLYLLLDGDNTELAINALRFLSINGIGGDANIGKGHFSFVVDDCNFIPEVKDPNCFMNLSLYYPTKDELLSFKEYIEIFNYELYSKKGKTGRYFNFANVWKERITFFKEGSIFPLMEKPYYGRCIKVKQDGNLNIYSNGFAFPLKFYLGR